MRGLWSQKLRLLPLLRLLESPFNLCRHNVSDKIKREIGLLKLLRHPHISRIFEVIDTPSDAVVVSEHCTGVEVFEYVHEHGYILEGVRS